MARGRKGTGTPKTVKTIKVKVNRNPKSKVPKFIGMKPIGKVKLTKKNKKR